MSTKNAYFADTDEKTFVLIKIIKTSFPNDQHLFEIRPAAGSDDPRGCVSIRARPGELLMEIKRISEWLETQL
jgi:hypothetical protein